MTFKKPPIGDLLESKKTFGKFLSNDSLEAVLSNCSLKWSAASTFNDPFDMQLNCFVDSNPILREECDTELHNIIVRPDLMQKSYSAHSHMMILMDILRHPDTKLADVENQFHNYAVKFISDMVDLSFKTHESVSKIVNSQRILCTSKEVQNSAMWSHYAGDHRGGFLIFNPNRCSGWGDKNSMRYSDTYPLIWKFDKIPKFLTAQIEHPEIENLAGVKDALLTKSKAWEYENEARFTISVGEDGDSDPIFRAFENNELLAVVFGCQLSHAQAMELMGRHRANYPETEFFHAQKLPFSFSLDFVRLS